MIDLAKEIKDINNLEEIIGCKVYEKSNNVVLFIQEVHDGGCWCGTSMLDQNGRYYAFSQLEMFRKK